MHFITKTISLLIIISSISISVKKEEVQNCYADEEPPNISFVYHYHRVKKSYIL
ncbi:Uncharacterised protein [Yersinia pekkanenii]|uniref:Uncharacterized protein n=1 Tax=Yersinia pekkanenii TaxID=1288385 RepID=A0A0T9Q8I3_9GAMM|nr:Uncharacterised protein [Yersinia pekkanenii]CRY63572.1 Uncharacterised protein [Yersinia pekkanenii]